jgi:hypothetical protein
MVFAIGVCRNETPPPQGGFLLSKNSIADQ